MAFQQAPLPYDAKALMPFVSEESFSYHYGKHHAAYFKNLNNLTQDTPFANMTLEQVILKADAGGVFNNAAQCWNHTFFWHCMTPSKQGKPDAKLLAAITKDFGSIEAFKEQFSKAATTLFGSGWAWLAKDAHGKLEIMALKDADTPMKHGKKAILTLDVWEHAYYIDYRNERPRFVQGFWDVANWDFASKNFA